MQQRELPPRPVLGADTEVVLDGVIFGKPRDAARRGADARAARRAARHEVLTGVALVLATTSTFALSHVARHVPRA